MGCKAVLLAAALAAALAGLVACGTSGSSGTSNGTGTSASTPPGRVAATEPGPASTQPPRPANATSRLPAGIGAVRIILVPGMNDKAAPPGPVTVTGKAKVGRLVALINGLSAFPSGTYSCPMDDGRGVRLTFLRAADGRALASALAAGNGCGGVTLTAGSKKSLLGWGNSAAQRALAIAGIRWNVWGPA
jgi:hypothetical protein